MLAHHCATRGAAQPAPTLCCWPGSGSFALLPIKTASLAGLTQQRRVRPWQNPCDGTRSYVPQIAQVVQNGVMRARSHRHDEKKRAHRVRKRASWTACERARDVRARPVATCRYKGRAGGGRALGSASLFATCRRCESDFRAQSSRPNAAAPAGSARLQVCVAAQGPWHPAAPAARARFLGRPLGRRLVFRMSASAQPRQSRVGERACPRQPRSAALHPRSIDWPMARTTPVVPAHRSSPPAPSACHPSHTLSAHSTGMLKLARQCIGKTKRPGTRGTPFTHLAVHCAPVRCTRRVCAEGFGSADRGSSLASPTPSE